MNETIKAYLLDAYGVFWAGNNVGLFPDAAEAMQRLVASGKVVGILSNTTQMVEKEIEKLAKHGVFQGVHYHFLITSGEVIRKVIANNEFPFPIVHKKYYLFCKDHPRYASHRTLFHGSDLQETDALEEADFIYISVPHIEGRDEIDPLLFKQEVKKLVKSRLPAVCANPDHFAHEGAPPRKVVRQGAIAALYESCRGTVFYIGKPHPIAYREAMNHFANFQITDPSTIVMVGDTPETDIRGGKKAGMQTVLLTETGMMADRIREHGKEKALRSIPKTDTPDYFMPRLSSL